MIGFYLPFTEPFILLVRLILINLLCRPRQSPFKPNDRVLLVTAHPDDECMFFGPTLCHLADRAIPAKVVCLSRGDFYGQGERRVGELAKAVALYEGVEHDCLDKLKDGPYVWPREKVADVVRAEMIKFKPTCIVTFDEKGVSG